MRIDRLRCNGMKDPYGIDYQSIRFTWSVDNCEKMEETPTFRVSVAVSLYDLESDENLILSENVKEIEYVCNDFRLESRKKYYWCVSAMLGSQCVAKSRIASFTAGLLETNDWKAQWIEPVQESTYIDWMDQDEELKRIGGDPFSALDKLHLQHWKTGCRPIEDLKLRPCQLVRKAFRLTESVKEATAYVTSHGIYRMYCNGVRVGNIEFAPEPTPYESYLQYQTYDLSDLLHRGENVIAFEIADGWWSGRIGTIGNSAQYGDMLALLTQVEITYTDDKTEVICSDNSFRSCVGGRRYSDLRVGEKYDANMEPKGWKEVGFDDSDWQRVHIIDNTKENLRAQNAQPGRVVDEIQLEKIYVSPKGEIILDFGQVVSGRGRFWLDGKKGQVVTFRYFEQTDKEGNYYPNIMGRNCHQEDVYVFAEDGYKEIETAFTYRAFRYVYLIGYENEIDISKQHALLIASDMEETIEFHCSSPFINNLYNVAQNSIRCNLLALPSDNADRERAGWTGDAVMTIPAATMYYDAEAFYRRWLKEMECEQTENGEIPTIIPYWKAYQGESVAAAGWSDSCVHIPLYMYKKTGDKRFLSDFYPMMCAYASYLDKLAVQATPKYLLSAEQLNNLGDWLQFSKTYNRETNEYCYFADSLRWMMTSYFYLIFLKNLIEVCEILKDTAAVNKWKKQYENVLGAAREHYYFSGRMKREGMNAIILGLHSGIIPAEQRENEIQNLLELIRLNGGCMDTGFESTRFILDELVSSGHSKEAFDLIFQEKLPSWGYELANGATAFWETWQGVRPNGEPTPVSFCQSAQSELGEKIIKFVAGLDVSCSGLGHFEVNPRFDNRIDVAEVQYVSRQGKISVDYHCDWENKQVSINVDVPYGCTANLKLFGINENLGAGHHAIEAVLQ